MKKSFLYLLFIALGLMNVQAQQLPNADMENWINKGNWLDPANWSTLNSLSNIGYATTVFRSSDSRSGNYSVELRTTQKQGTDALPGLLSTGNAITKEFGIPFNGRPHSMEFSFKYLPTDIDTGFIFMALLKDNGSLKDTIAELIFLISDSSAQWTDSTIKFNYLSNETPDELIFIAVSSTNRVNPPVGSSFLLDDFKLKYFPTGIEQSKHDKITVYPNPSTDKIYLYNLEENRKIEIYDHLGRLVLKELYQENGLNISHLKEGIYHIKVEQGINTQIIVKHGK